MKKDYHLAALLAGVELYDHPSQILDAIADSNQELKDLTSKIREIDERRDVVYARVAYFDVALIKARKRFHTEEALGVARDCVLDNETPGDACGPRRTNKIAAIKDLRERLTRETGQEPLLSDCKELIEEAMEIEKFIWFEGLYGS